ncbi:MAG: hypothetical protein HWE34_06970 [Methylocystaceae bacterium]|nr:hypothetical protein [Methylocystaceae bacterium]
MGDFPTDDMDKKARLLTFFYEGARFGFDASHLSSIEPLEEGDDNLKEATTIEAHLGLATSLDKQHYRYALHFKKQANVQSEILVNGPIELVELSADSIYALPRLIHSRLLYANVLALGEWDGAFFFLLRI